MSDKFFMHDCNSYTHTSQNTYRAECRDSKQSVVRQATVKEPVKKTLKWWQRLWEHDTQRATT